MGVGWGGPGRCRRRAEERSAEKSRGGRGACGQVVTNAKDGGALEWSGREWSGVQRGGVGRGWAGWSGVERGAAGGEWSRCCAAIQKICAPIRHAYRVLTSFGKMGRWGESALRGSGTRGALRSRAGVDLNPPAVKFSF